jgi:sugar phosphate isomerase/epimerase
MKPTTRRQFIQQTGILSAAMLLPTDKYFKLNKNVGVQLYTLRDQIFKDPRGTIQKVGSIGYKEVESFGYNNGKYFGLTAKEFADLLAQNNLSHPSGHYALANLTAWDKAIEDAIAAGQKYMVIAYLADTDRKSLDDYKKHAADFNAAADKCKKAGLQFAYHNHDFEFKDWNGQTGYQVLLKETDPALVKFEMDIYWVRKADQDPIALFKHNANRFPLWHVKDMDKTEKKSFTEVGNGVIDFKKIFECAKKSGMQHFFVEQDVSADPMASIQRSYQYIESSLVKELS